MRSSVMDPCLFYRTSNALEGIQGTLVDDTLSAGTRKFVADEESASKEFLCKKKSTNFPLMFAGSSIKMCTGSDDVPFLRYSHPNYAEQINVLDPKNNSFDDFVHSRGQIGYHVSVCGPRAAYLSAQLSQVTKSSFESSDVKNLNKAISVLRNDSFITFPKLDISSVAVVGYSDASFATNKDNSSQLGMVVLLKDKDDNAALIHYTSWKCRRVTRSILAAEVHAFAACFDYCITLAYDLSAILAFHVPVLMFTDSKCLFDTITKLSTVSEKRLLIDISALRESYACGELTNVAHVSSENNLADPFTKNTTSPILDELLNSGKLSHPISQWIIHN